MISYDGIKSVNERVNRIEVRKGKFYADVAGRVQAFRELCPNGSISTEVVRLDGDMCVIKATVCDEEGRVLGTGHAYERESSTQINRTSFIENCETSAVGRALGMIGIGSESSMATAEEMVNALNQQKEIEDKIKAELESRNKKEEDQPKTEEKPAAEEIDVMAEAEKISKAAASKKKTDPATDISTDDDNFDEFTPVN